MNCEDTRLSLGVYVMGALDVADLGDVEGHLRTCARCRDELAELSGLPSLLDQLTLDDLNPEPVPLPDDLFDRVAAKALEEKGPTDISSRRRNRRVLSAAAAVVIATGGGFGVWSALQGPRHFQSTANSKVHMDVTLASQATGTSYTVSVTGLPTDEHCRLIAVGANGARDLAGEWDATYQGEAKETGSTSIPRDQLARLVLLGTNGKRLSVVTV